MTRSNDTKPQLLAAPNKRCAAVLRRSAHTILTDASHALARAHLLHYDQSDPHHNWERLSGLYDWVLDGVEHRRSRQIVRHAEQCARERFAAGFRLREVQVAFNVLEEAIWERLLAELDPEDFAGAIGLVSAVIGTARDAFANAFVRLVAGAASPRRAAPARRVSDLFKGTEGP